LLRGITTLSGGAGPKGSLESGPNQQNCDQTAGPDDWQHLRQKVTQQDGPALDSDADLAVASDRAAIARTFFRLFEV
jgi:hypothetical protein